MTEKEAIFKALSCSDEIILQANSKHYKTTMSFKDPINIWKIAKLIESLA